jgi:hypothetical protein
LAGLISLSEFYNNTTLIIGSSKDHLKTNICVFTVVWAFFWGARIKVAGQTERQDSKRASKAPDCAKQFNTIVGLKDQQPLQNQY